MKLTKTNIAGAILALTLAASGSMAMAKGHEQGLGADKIPNATGPGQNVDGETVAGAHTLGAALGGGVGPQ